MANKKGTDMKKSNQVVLPKGQWVRVLPSSENELFHNQCGMISGYDHNFKGKEWYQVSFPDETCPGNVVYAFFEIGTQDLSCIQDPKSLKLHDNDSAVCVNSNWPQEVRDMVLDSQLPQPGGVYTVLVGDEQECLEGKVGVCGIEDGARIFPLVNFQRAIWSHLAVQVEAAANA